MMLQKAFRIQLNKKNNMKKGKSEIIIILDRSGSMSDIKTDMEGGIKTYIEEQKKLPGECYVSLYQFDTDYDAVFENKDIKSVSNIFLIPRGGTALLDAIGKTINSIGERLDKTLENERPESVIIVVITDGEENSSKEFTLEQIKKLIKHQTDVYNWRFIFLGADQDAIKSGTTMGFASASSMSFAKSSKGILSTFDTFNKASTHYRTAGAAASAYVVSDKEREDAMEDDQKNPKNIKKNVKSSTK